MSDACLALSKPARVRMWYPDEHPRFEKGSSGYPLQACDNLPFLRPAETEECALFSLANYQSKEEKAAEHKAKQLWSPRLSQRLRRWYRLRSMNQNCSRSNPTTKCRKCKQGGLTTTQKNATQGKSHEAVSFLNSLQTVPWNAILCDTHTVKVTCLTPNGWGWKVDKGTETSDYWHDSWTTTLILLNTSEIAEAQVFQKASEVTKSMENTIPPGQKNFQRTNAQGSIVFPLRNYHSEVMTTIR